MATEKKLIDKIIYTNEDIVEASKKLASQLNKVYEGKEVVLVTIMSGGLPFTHELMKHLEFDVYMDFVAFRYTLYTVVLEIRLLYQCDFIILTTDKHLLEVPKWKIYSDKFRNNKNICRTCSNI